MQEFADHRVSFIPCGGYVSNVMAVLLYNTTNFSRLILLVGGLRGHPKELPQQARTIETISGHTYIRKWISLIFFIKKLIL